MLVRQVVGQLELVEGDHLLHPLLPCRRAVRVDVHALWHLRVGLARDDPLAARNSGNVYPRCYTPTDWGIGWALTCHKKAIYSLWRNEWVKGSDNINIGRTSNAAPARLVRFGEPQCRPPSVDRRWRHLSLSSPISSSDKNVAILVVPSRSPLICLFALR